MRLVIGALGHRAILDTLNSQRGEWEERHAAEVSLQPETSQQASLEGLDLIVFPGERVGDLIDQRLLYAIPESALHPPAPAEPEGAETAKPNDPLAFADVLPAFRDEVSRYGHDRPGLPLGGSALVLAYRRDALENQANLVAAKDADLTLQAPLTWDQLDALAKFLHGRDWDGDGQPEAGIALAWGDDPEGVGDAAYLARAAALGQHPDQFSLLFDSSTMQPRLTTQPFVEALEKLAALTAFGPPNAPQFDAEAARGAFRTGTVALLIDRAERVATWVDADHAATVGVAALPGSERVFDPSQEQWQPVSPPNRVSYLPFGGGWLVGIPASCTGVRREAALSFLKHLIGPDTSTRILADRDFPMLPTRSSQLGAGLPNPRSAPGVDPRLWGRAVADAFTAARVIPGLRIPEADQYLADLAKARVEAADGRLASEALAAAAKVWAERTKRLGVERQLWHYRRSLVRPSTPAEPPPR
jgi:multiple sugar transport system substrate-binding protein